MSPVVRYAADAAAILILIALFVRRHGRRDLIAAYLGVNGVLSIIRLRRRARCPSESAFQP